MRVARSRMGVADLRVGPVLGYERASDFLALLRPGWWVLRAYLLAMLITVLTTSEFYLMPELGGSVVAGFLMLVALLVGSVWLGRRERRLNLWPRIFVGATERDAGALRPRGGRRTTTSAVRACDGYYQSDYQDPYVNVAGRVRVRRAGPAGRGRADLRPERAADPVRAARTTAIRTRTSRSRCGTSTRSAPTSPRSASHPAAARQPSPPREPTAEPTARGPAPAPAPTASSSPLPRTHRDARSRRLPELTRRLARANNCLHLLGGAWRHRA